MRRSIATLIAAAAVVSACSAVDAPRQLRGNRIDADQLKELTPGTSTRADAVSLLGSPTVRATFDDNTWIYVSATTRTRVGRTPGIVSQDVTVLSFDPAGVLRDVKRLNEEDSKELTIVSRATPSPGSEASFIQQLLGNVGKFNAGGATGGSRPTPGGSGANNPAGGI
ncbi:MAG: outer membrane protein assembly factor BamE [Gemmatimonadaceae bacterium]|nr:outer membrane protein assembly factor BamE [Acetobacteraceae bacterium]